MVDFYLIRKKEELAEMATRCHSLSLVVIPCPSLYQSLSLVVPLVVIRCHSLVSINFCPNGAPYLIVENV